MPPKGQSLREAATPEDLAILLSQGRGAGSRTLLLALLELRVGDEPDPIRTAADRLLSSAAPWALDYEARLRRCFKSAGDNRDRSLFAAWSSTRSPSSTAELAGKTGISSERVRQIVSRVDARLRAGLAGESELLSWLASTLRRLLAEVLTVEDARLVLDRIGIRSALGVVGGPAELALWIAGPYRPIPSRPGWLALDPRGIVARTAAAMARDGGVRRIEDVDAELGLDHERLIPWLCSGDVVIIHDLAVSLAGPLPSVVERILDAHGCRLDPGAVAGCLARARTVSHEALRAATAGPRFKRWPDGTLGLASWPDDHSGNPQITPPTAAGTTAAAGTGAAGTGAAGTGAAGTGAAGTGAAGARPGGTTAAAGRRPAAARVPAKSAPTRGTAGSKPARKAQQVSARRVPAKARAGPPAKRRSALSEVSSGLERHSLWVRVDAEVLRGKEGPVPEALVDRLGVGPGTRRTFSSRYGPIVLANDSAQALRGSVRAVALASGARTGDTLLLGFAGSGDVTVEVNRTTDEAGAVVSSATEPNSSKILPARDRRKGMQ